MGGRFGSAPAEIKWDVFDALAGLPRQVITNRHIAGHMGVSIRTLERAVKKKFKESIDAVREQKAAPIRQETFVMLYNSAKRGNIAAQIFLSKNLLDFSDNNRSAALPDAPNGKVTYTAEWGASVEAPQPGAGAGDEEDP